MPEAIRLTKSYNGKKALRDVSFKVNGGDIFCLLGANGAGKATTINIFLNFVKPSKGTAMIGGKDVAKEPIESKKLLAYIPENLMLYPNLSGLENLEYFSGLAEKKYSNDQLRDFLLEADIQVEEHKKRISTYSKAMRQKVGVAIALARQAQVLFLDEPTSGLDPKASNEFSAMLRKLSAKGVATLMATHDLFHAKETSTHVGIMKAGAPVELLTTDQINHTDLEKLYLKHMN